ncbi:MAG TPA: hypothetical protein VIH90_06455 [Candidatus Saccharimonadales bacterium]
MTMGPEGVGEPQRVLPLVLPSGRLDDYFPDRVQARQELIDEHERMLKEALELALKRTNGQLPLERSEDESEQLPLCAGLVDVYDIRLRVTEDESDTYALCLVVAPRPGEDIYSSLVTEYTLGAEFSDTETTVADTYHHLRAVTGDREALVRVLAEDLVLVTDGPRALYEARTAPISHTS